ncbi:MAG: hypothetical protein ABIS36_02950 [Chryseolinea sp.]
MSTELMRVMQNSKAYLQSVVLVLLFGLVPFLVHAQKASLDSLVKKFDTYRTVASSEKIYAHLDKTVCLVGETVWFKLYLVNGSTHLPEGLSKVAYIEIVDAFNRPVVQSKVALKEGQGRGLLYIPASVPTGKYTFRTYTNWMKNFNAEAFFHKEISIINSFRPIEESKAQSTSTPIIQFFPEGGNLVDGIKSRIAFRFTKGINSLPNEKVMLLNDVNDTLATFQPDSMGLGSVEFRASKSEKYHLSLPGRINLGGAKFPDILDKGYVLSVRDSTDKQIALKIESSIISNESPFVFVVIHSRNMISLSATQVLSSGKAIVMVDKAKLYQGISHITVFDMNVKPVCERLFFSPVKSKLKVQTNLSQTQFGLRRKVVLDIVTTNEHNDPISASVSMAVNRLDSLVDKDDANLFSYLWLSSDLPEVPDLPLDFFASTSNRKKVILDNIMMVNGWRKFKWQSVVEGPPLLSFAPEARGHIIMGKVTREDQARSRVLTYLSSPGLNIQVYGSISDDKGNVKYEMKDFYGTRKVVVQTNFSLDSISRVQILSPFSDKFSKRSYKPLILPPSLEPTLTSRNISMQVQDIFYQDRGAASRNSSIDTTAFYGKADETYYLDDYTRFPVMEEIMREYVPGVLVRKRKDGFHFFNVDINHKSQFDEDPFILLDGIPIFDADKIMSFDPLKVKKLEVITRRYYLGALSLPGVVSFTTYRGDLGGFQLDPKSVVLDYDGLQLQREFYAPNYETKKLRDSRMPDQRNLLYWAPDVNTDSSGQKRIEFFTSDLEGDFKILIEGIDQQGRAGSGHGSFRVRAFEN